MSVERIQDLRNHQTGLKTLWCLLNAKQWIHRRVERIELINTVTLRKTIVVEYQVPPYAPRLGGAWGEASVLLPLGVMKKAPLRNFDLRDADGRALPYLHTMDNTIVAQTTVNAFAKLVLGHPPSHETRAALAAVVKSPPVQGAYVTNRLWPRLASPGMELTRLWQHPVFAAWVRTFAQGFMLLVPLRASLGHRDVVSWSHTTDYSVSRAGYGQLGLRPTEVEIQSEEASLCHSYHVALEAPTDLQVVSFQSRPVRDDKLALDFYAVEADNELYIQRDEHPGAHAHVHLGDVAFGQVSLSVAGLRAIRRGWLRSSMLAAVATTLMLGVLAFHFDAVTERMPEGGQPGHNISASLLLTLVAVAATFLSRPGEHALAALMLRSVRWIAAVPPLMALAMTLTLVTGRESYSAWWSLVVLSGTCAAIMTWISLSQPDD